MNEDWSAVWFRLMIEWNMLAPALRRARDGFRGDRRNFCIETSCEKYVRQGSGTDRLGQVLRNHFGSSRNRGRAISDDHWTLHEFGMLKQE